MSFERGKDSSKYLISDQNFWRFSERRNNSGLQLFMKFEVSARFAATNRVCTVIEKLFFISCCWLRRKTHTCVFTNHLKLLLIEWKFSAFESSLFIEQWFYLWMFVQRASMNRLTVLHVFLVYFCRITPGHLITLSFQKRRAQLWKGWRCLWRVSLSRRLTGE